jgi:hypothetical protein
LLHSTLQQKGVTQVDSIAAISWHTKATNKRFVLYSVYITAL